MKQTAVELLFSEFRALGKAMRDAGDEPLANLINFLCEREEVTKEMEKQQIVNSYEDGYSDSDNIFELNKQYYNETFKKSN